MTKLFSHKVSRWILPTVLIMLVLQVATLPLVLSLTYSDRSETPTHVLNYSRGKLAWDSGDGVEPSGAVVLDLFDYFYGDTDVLASNQENLIAPGTEGLSIVRLKNNVGGKINYTAVLYRMDTDAAIPVEMVLTGKDFADTADYPLPDGVSADQVVRAVSGTVTGGGIQDFDLSWFWEYYVSDQQDTVDTALGNKGTDEITVGLYVVVEDNNSYVVPETPATGDNSVLLPYIVMMAVSFVMMVLLLIERYREHLAEKRAGEENA